MIQENAITTISLSGSDWFIHEDAAGSGERDGLPLADPGGPGWIPAAVPGNIQADLEAAQRLKPLWYGAGDPRLAGVAQKDWWYRRDFQLPADLAQRRLTLVFDGVDFAAEVWLNGQRLGANAGMYRRFSFDISAIAKPDARNQLAVKIERIPAELVHILGASDGKLSGGGENYPREWGPDFFVNGINQTRQLLKDLKSPTNYGWDWGVNIYTLGIWQDVRIEASGSGRIEWLRAQTDLSPDFRRATIRSALEIDSLDARPVSATFRVYGQGQAVDAAVTTDLQPGVNIIEAELTLEDPALWWPNGQGPQPLYTLEASLEDAETGHPLHRRATRFALRQIRWEQVAGAPADFINPYQLVVNGRDVRMLGSNLIPPDLLFGRMNARGLRLIQLARQAGANTLRIWGGGALMSDDMLSLADELGIMVSLEFPLASCQPETDAVFMANLETTLRGIVKRHRNHPCIIEWSGGNEMLWHQGQDHPGLHLMTRIVAEEDDRLFRATCPIQGARHSPWHYDPDTHYAHYDDENLRDSGILRGQEPLMRYGEFGCHSLAHPEIWQREIPPADQFPPDDLENPTLIRKNVVQSVFDEKFWLIKPTLDALFGSLETLQALTRAGQFLGAHGIRYAVDALRRRGRSIGGILTWVFNEPWPNGAGPYHVDYDGRPLMGFDYLKDALTPLSLSLRQDSIVFDPAEGLAVELWLVSDRPGVSENLGWAWLARDRRGRVLARNQGRASIDPLGALELDAIRTGPIAADAGGPLLLELRLMDADDAILSERAHVFGNADSAAPLAGLLGTPAAGDEALAGTALTAEVSAQSSDGGRESLQITLRNQGEMTALFCQAHPLLAYRTDIDVDNNHICVPPGESRVVTVSAAIESGCGLTLSQTGWRISCWNADDVVIPPSADVALSLGRRDATTHGYLGYDDLSVMDEARELHIEGNRPDAAAIPLLMRPGQSLHFTFAIERGWERAASLRLHSADQHPTLAPEISLRVNGRQFRGALPTGLGIHSSDPAHLAFPQSLEMALPAGVLVQGQNALELRIENESWFSWDALDLILR